ncbi:MAG: CHASE domain-containing protein [Myxococcota bacterium]
MTGGDGTLRGHGKRANVSDQERNEENPERTMRIAGVTRRRQRRRPGARERWRTSIPYWVLGTGLLVTAVTLAMVRGQVVEDDRVRFEHHSELVVSILADRMRQYEDALRAADGFMRASRRMDAEKFHRFAETLSIEDHAGLRTLGYAARVQHAAVGEHEEQMRSEGFEGFEVWPAFRPQEHLVLTYVEPLTGSNRAALGYDLAVASEVREAFEQACASGSPAATGPVDLVGTRNPGGRNGFMVVMPTYFRGAKPRCDQVRGYAVAALERQPFFNAMGKALPKGQLDFQVVDGSAEEGLMYQSTPGEPRAGRGSNRFRGRRELEVAGRPWIVKTWPGPRFDDLSQRRFVPYVLVAGVMISLALFGLVWSESRARSRAEEVARELYRSEEALTRANQAKDEFLAMLGHELRNPLSAMKMALDILRTAKIEDPDARAALEVANRQMRHQRRLVDDLLDVSRVSRGKIALKLQRLDLREVVTDAVTSIESSEAAGRHGFTVDRPAEPVLVEGDPTRLEQVIANLLANAVKYSPEGGRVHVGVEHDGQEAILRVRDDGMGLDPNAIDRIFDLFAQEDTSLDRAAGGLGIGLTLVKRLVEMHGGTVRARSEGRGKGSEFEVRVPLSDHTPPAARMPLGTDGRRALRILLVEDNEDARVMMRSLLEKQGHHVETASDGESGVQAALEDAPDVALVDIGLPAMDGLEVARRLRAAWDGQGPVLIAVTGYGQPGDRRRSEDAGFDHHVVKPVDPEELRELLSHVEPVGDAASRATV